MPRAWQLVKNMHGGKSDNTIARWGAKFAEPLTFVTGLLFIATLLLFCATRNLVNDAADTARRQLRAYIFVEKASVRLEGRTFKSEVDLKNSGQTPGYDAVVTSHLETHDIGDQTPLQEPSVLEAHKGIMGPGIVTNPYSELTVPAQNDTTIPGTEGGTVKIYLIGRAEYRDAFDQTWILDFRFESFKFDRDHWLMEPTKDGNEERKKN
jgi:hypothetical protein